ncbi:MAG: flagellar hook-length control protein FliK [Pseudomonadota bacterium]|nr:flagellar hook-length control protein FliK [Pseudomonadota bacterium]MED5443884.1 flagellar hook-length control protein FliK [Pseudomonadota bacterium]
MALGPEQIGAVPRPLPIFLEGRALVLAPAAAQELGLKGGQIIELVSALVDGRPRLLYGDRALQLAGQAPFPPGDRRSFRLRSGAQGMILEPVAPPPKAPAAAQSAPVSSAPQLSSLFRQLASPGLALAHRAAGLARLFELSERAPSVLQLGLPRLALEDLDGPSLRASLLHSGLFFEAQLAQRKPVSPLDLKRALLRVGQAAPPNSELARLTGEVLGGLERAQAEGVVASQQRNDLSLAWVVSFRNGPAVALELERELAKERGTPPLWVVHAATTLPSLGPLWMRTRFSLEGRVAFTLWAPEPGVAELARGEQGSLQEELAALQLQLESFAVHAHPREDRT